jgi:hypothetical protein
VRGGIHGAKKIPGLMRLSARYVGAPDSKGSSLAEIGLPDGSTRRTGEVNVNERLSAALTIRSTPAHHCRC